MPPDPVGQARRLSAPASTRSWGGRSRPPRAQVNSRAAPTARGSAPLGTGLDPLLGWAFSPAARTGQLTRGSHRARLGASRHRPTRIGRVFLRGLGPRLAPLAIGP